MNLNKTIKFLIPIIIIFIHCIPALGKGTKIGDLYYNLNSSAKTAEVTYSTTDYPGSTDEENYAGLTTLTIPSTVEYNGEIYTVTSIGYYAFYGCSGFTGDLIIPNSVTSIGASAFRGCSGFTRVEITDLENWCRIKFSGWDSNPLYNSHHLYLNGEEIRDLHIPESITTINDYAFAGGTGITGKLTIPNSVTSIGNFAFDGCSGFTGELVIPNSVTSIGIYAFDDCSGLNGKLSLPNSITQIEHGAFSGCSGFTGDLVIPETVTSIGGFAFFGCSGLNGTLTLPNSITQIGEYTFCGCSGLTGELVIPNSVTSIGIWAFDDCSGFKGDLIIPNSVILIGYRAFAGCSGFTGDLVIPNSVTEIGGSTFYGCSGFTGDLIIPNSVSSIGTYAFCNCSGFTGELVIPNSVTSIGNSAFYGCSGFNSLVLPETINSYPEDVFNRIPFEEITCWAKNPPLLESKRFDYSVYTNACLYVPLNSIGLYRNAEYWKKFNCINAITIDATGITLDKSEINLYVSESTTLRASLSPEDASTNVLWSVDRDGEGIVSVDQNGKVTALSVGQATVTATAGEVSATCRVTVNPRAVTSITLNVEDLTLYVGETDQLKATVYPADTPNPQITWMSSNPSVAKVDADGKVTAVSVGIVTITATCGGASASCKVTVNPRAVTNITLNVEDLTLYVGESDQLKATVYPADTPNPQITWMSSNPSVAKVDSDGRVTAVSVGIVTITATCGGASASCKVTVRNVMASNIVLNVEDLTLYVGETDNLTATVYPENTTYPTVTWSSDKTSVVLVDYSGKVTALSVGVATITAQCGNAKATCKVTVKSLTPTSISLNTETLSMYVGDTDQLTAKVYPEDVADPTVSWKSDNEAVAKVDSKGIVTAISPGKATITAYSGKVNATCIVTVRPVAASSIELNAEDLTLVVGETDRLTATVYPENTTYPEITWMSDDTSVAAVEGGVVTAVSPGVATITASCRNASAKCRVTVVAPQSKADTPTQLLRKGDGSSHTFVAMMDRSDEALEAEGYRYVFGYDNSIGKSIVIEDTPWRYTYTSGEVYWNKSYDFWVFAYYKESDGTIEVSSRRHLDGTVDNDFNPANLIGGGSRSGEHIIGIYTIDGQYMGKDLDKLESGIYVVRTNAGSYKIIK